MKRAYVDIPEGQMHYRYAGTGEAVVMIHMSGSSSDEYEQVGECLAKRFAVYAIDLLAFGESDKPPRHYSLQEHAKTIISFMDAIGIGSAYLIGNLVGSNISVHVATMHPDRVKGLMLGQVCYNPDPQYYKNRRHAPVFSQVIPVLDGSHLVEIWARSAKYGESARISDARAIWLHKAGEWGESLHWALCEDEDLEAQLQKIAVPTVVVAYGKCVSEKFQIAVAELIPNAKYECISDATPYVARKTPDVFASLFFKYF